MKWIKNVDIKKILADLVPFSLKVLGYLFPFSLAILSLLVSIHAPIFYRSFNIWPSKMLEDCRPDIESQKLEPISSGNSESSDANQYIFWLDVSRSIRTEDFTLLKKTLKELIIGGIHLTQVNILQNRYNFLKK